MHYPVEFLLLDAVIGLLKVNIYLVYIHIEFPTLFQDLFDCEKLICSGDDDAAWG
jgi:hypothetical protein